MKITEKNRLVFFDGLFRAAKEKQDALYETMQRSLRQYRGSKETDGGLSAETIRNITYELIESQVSTEIPAPKVTSYSASKCSEKNARRIQALLSSLRDRLPYEKINDMDERYTYIYGGSVTLVEWDDTMRHRGEVGSVRLSQISPPDFVGQPGLYEIDDMEYCFLVFDTTAEDLCRRYGMSSLDAEGFESADGSDDAVTMVVCFYKNEEGRISRFIWSGEKVLSDIDDYYARKRRVCRVCGEAEGVCRCEKKALFDEVSEEYEVLAEGVVRADGEVIPAGSRLRRYRPHRFPLVIRKNTSQEKSLFGQSDCLFIRPQQIEVNKILTRVHEKLIMSGIYPYKPDDCQFRYDNSIGGKVLNLRPGETPKSFGMIDTTPDIAQDLAYIEATYRDAKRILGISDAYTGDDESAGKSAESRRIQVAQSEGRLVSKRVMKNAAYAECDRLIFEMYLAYADEPRALTLQDSLGKSSQEAFCRYDFLEFDPTAGEYFYDDDYLFSVEGNRPSRDEREALWKYNLENYRQGGFGVVGEALSLARYWAAQARCSYPGAREQVSHFTAASLEQEKASQDRV